MDLTRDRRWLAVGSIALVVGVGSIAVPGRLLRLLGTPNELNGRDALAWRLFGARNLAIVAGILLDDQPAKIGAVVLQLSDQAAFVAAFREGHIERRTFALAMVLSNAIVGLGASALSSRRRLPDGRQHVVSRAGRGAAHADRRIERTATSHVRISARPGRSAASLGR